MKGVVLAGGLGTRLMPMTRVTNKHLLPVYDRPMIHYPLQALVHAGIRDILLITGGNNAGDFLRLLRNGAEFGLARLSYAYQEGEGGIAAALLLAEDFSDGGPVTVMLGDNLFQRPLAPVLAPWLGDPRGAFIVLAEVPDPERFGVAEFDGGGGVARLVEKPATPPSRLAVTGLYGLDHRAFNIVRELSPSERGELEITELLNRYLSWGELRHAVLEGWWTDAGTVDSLYRATRLVARERGRDG
jgi:glucose-1-phosphate thymidylyltransferase